MCRPAAESVDGSLDAQDPRIRHAAKPRLWACRPAVSESIGLTDRHAVGTPIEDARNAEMAHLNKTIHVEPPNKAKQHGVPVV